MKLLWLDTETTGLDPQRDKLLEVAGLVTDLTTPFAQEGEVVQDVLPVTEEEAASFSPFIIDMHGKNGLMVECIKTWNERWNDDEAALRSYARQQARQTTRFPTLYLDALWELEEKFLAIVPEATDKKQMTALAGSSVHFDLGFLRTHMPRLSQRLSHRCYDVSAVKLFCRSLGMPKPLPEEAHRALADVEESMRHAQHCAEWLKDYGWRSRRDEAMQVLHDAILDQDKAYDAHVNRWVEKENKS